MSYRLPANSDRNPLGNVQSEVHHPSKVTLAAVGSQLHARLQPQELRPVPNQSTRLFVRGRQSTDQTAASAIGRNYKQIVRDDLDTSHTWIGHPVNDATGDGCVIALPIAVNDHGMPPSSLLTCTAEKRRSTRAVKHDGDRLRNDRLNGCLWLLLNAYPGRPSSRAPPWRRNADRLCLRRS